MIWMYRSQQVLYIPLTDPWILKKQGGGVVKYNTATHEEEELSKEDYVKAIINFMSDPVYPRDFTDGVNLICLERTNDCISWVNVANECRHVAYYNFSCSKIPLSCYNFLMYDSLQGVFTIQDTLANNVHKADKDEVAEACKQIVDLLYAPLNKDVLPQSELTPVRKNLFLQFDPCIKHLFSSLKDSSSKHVLEVTKRSRNHLQQIAQRKKKRRNIKWSKKSQESAKVIREIEQLEIEQLRALYIFSRIRHRQELQFND